MRCVQQQQRQLQMSQFNEPFFYSFGSIGSFALLSRNRCTLCNEAQPHYAGWGESMRVDSEPVACQLMVKYHMYSWRESSTHKHMRHTNK